MQQRKIGKGLSELLGQPTEIKRSPTPKYNLNLENTDVFAVLRSKGGSGEKHSVREVSKELLNTYHRVITIVREEDDPYYQFLTSDFHLFTPYSKQTSIENSLSTLLSNKDNMSYINCNWTNLNLLNEILLSVDKLSCADTKTAILLTIGTASGSAYSLTKQLKLLTPYCKKLYISVDSNVENSFDAAKIAVKNRKEFKGKTKLFCWLSYKNCFNSEKEKFSTNIKLVKKNHHYLILPSIEYQQLSIEELQIKVLEHSHRVLKISSD